MALFVDMSHQDHWLEYENIVHSVGLVASPYLLPYCINSISAGLLTHLQCLGLFTLIHQVYAICGC